MTTLGTNVDLQGDCSVSHKFRDDEGNSRHRASRELCCAVPGEEAPRGPMRLGDNWESLIFKDLARSRRAVGAVEGSRLVCYTPQERSRKLVTLG